MNVPSHSSLRTIVAFAIGPITPGLVVALASYSIPGESWVPGFFVFISALLGYPIALLFGLPFFYVMRRYNRNELYCYLLAGPVLGVIAVAIFCIYAAPSNTWSLKWLVGGGLMGSISTLSFWLIARPDRSQDGAFSGTKVRCYETRMYLQPLRQSSAMPTSTRVNDPGSGTLEVVPPVSDTSSRE